MEGEERRTVTKGERTKVREEEAKKKDNATFTICPYVYHRPKTSFSHCLAYLCLGSSPEEKRSHQIHKKFNQHSHINYTENKLHLKSYAIAR